MSENLLVEDLITLQQAAAELGVHYMTAYRYVRLGQLPATKTGGSWRVRRSDLASVRTAVVSGVAAKDPGSSTAATPALDSSPSVTSDPGEPPAAPLKGRNRRAPWAQRLEQRLLVGDTAGAWGVMEAAMASGSGIEECYLDVLVPAMRSIGSRWERGELDIAVEHLASSIAGRLIERLGARTFRRGRSRGSVLLGAAAGERHSLPVAVLADLVRLAGWDIIDLGADVPAASFVHAARTVGEELVAVGVSSSTAESNEAARLSVVALRAVVPEHTLLVVGGLGVRDADHARELGADGFAADAREFVTLLETVRVKETGAG